MQQKISIREGLIAPIALSCSLFGLYLLLKYTDFNLQVGVLVCVCVGGVIALSCSLVELYLLLKYTGFHLRACGGRTCCCCSLLQPEATHTLEIAVLRWTQLQPHTSNALIAYTQTFTNAYFWLLGSLAIGGATVPLLARVGDALGQPTWQITGG